MRRLALLTVLLLPGAAHAQADDFFAIRKNFELFGRIYEILASQYVDAVDAERLMRTGLGAMTGALDPYTVFFDEATAAAGRLQQGQDVGGVGLVVADRDGRLVIIDVADASSAGQQGVRPGDAVLTVGGRATAGVAAATVQELLRGEPGSTVPVTVERDGAAEPLSFVLVRAAESRDEVSYSGFVGDPAEGVGYVRLGRFLGDASAEVDAALQALAAERPLTAVVLDLRGNPGGLLQEAVDLSGLFLPAGTLVTATRGRAEGMDETYRTAAPPTLPDVPLAILVDRVSASASEIVAGAIQDHDRGVIVGETTFGKGLVQVVRPLPYGTALKLTVSRYTTPVGREIQRLDYHQGERAAAVPDSLRRTFRTTGGRAVRSGGGIEPDLPVALGEESELEDALVRAASFLRFANRYAAEHPALAPSFQVDDALFDDFKRFVAADGAATYQTAPEEALAQLDTDLAASGYTATVELRALRQAVEREKARDMDRHAARLRTRLRDEILSRYVGRRDVTTAALAADPALEAARGALRDARRYAALLGR